MSLDAAPTAFYKRGQFTNDTNRQITAGFYMAREACITSFTE